VVACARRGQSSPDPRQQRKVALKSPLYPSHIVLVLAGQEPHVMRRTIHRQQWPPGDRGTAGEALPQQLHMARSPIQGTRVMPLVALSCPFSLARKVVLGQRARPAAIKQGRANRLRLLPDLPGHFGAFPKAFQFTAQSNLERPA
jgi:hypothetical protein